MKDTTTIASEVVTLCREGKFEQIYAELFDPESIQSIEPQEAIFETVRGMDAIIKKGEMWNAMVEEVISSEVSDPLVAEDFFSLTMKINVKLKNMPEAIQMDEICVYQVRNGKIVKEQFFYTPEAHGA